MFSKHHCNHQLQGRACIRCSFAGRRSAGVYRDVNEACEKAIQVVKVQNPIEENIPFMKNIIRVYTDLYPALKGSYRNYWISAASNLSR